ncbi:hypothetical protein ABMB67_001790 [Halalkalibacter oceani]
MKTNKEYKEQVEAEFGKPLKVCFARKKYRKMQ